MRSVVTYSCQRLKDEAAWMFIICISSSWLLQKKKKKSWAPWKCTWLLGQILSNCITEEQPLLIKSMGVKNTSIQHSRLSTAYSREYVWTVSSKFIKNKQTNTEFKGTSPFSLPHTHFLFTLATCIHCTLPQVTRNTSNLHPLGFQLLEHLNLLWKWQGNNE